MSEASISQQRGAQLNGPLRLRSDDHLARLAARGDERAFSAIYERHHQGLYRYCRSILRDDEEARDALQNTMMQALDALPGEEREIALKPWLYRIARNESISIVRRRQPATAVQDPDELVDPRGDDEETRDRLRSLVRDLAQLPERQRSALVMRELNGLGYEEIGETLDSSPAAAKQSVYEAREALHVLEEGREMQCEAARQSISANDRRLLRGRKLRAHLRSCASCRTFQLGMQTRTADLAVLAPPLPAAAAASVLAGVLGGGGGAAGGGGLLALLTGAGGAGSSVGGSAAVKGAAAVAVTIAAGVGAYEVADRVGAGDGNQGGDSSAATAAQTQGVDGASTRSAGGEGGKGGNGGDRDAEKGSGGKGSGGGRKGGTTTSPAPGAEAPSTGGGSTGTGTGGGSGAETTSSPSLTETVTETTNNVTNGVQDVVENTTSGVKDTVDQVTSQTGLDKLLPQDP